MSQPMVAPKQDALEQQATLPEIRFPLPDLPRLDWEWGYKFARNEQTGEVEQVQLTLLDVLYPTGEDFYMAESWHHHWLAGLLELMIRLHLADKGWLVFGNVFIHWPWPQFPPLAPDVTAISRGEYPTGSYHVGVHGVNPSFVIEITSPYNRENDLVRKRQDYAAAGVPEYLLIDLHPDGEEDYQILGYQFNAGPFYDALDPDEEGGLTFETVGLRFVMVSDRQIDIFDVETGEQLLPPEDWYHQVREAVKSRRQAEKRAIKAEAEAAEAKSQAAKAEQQAAEAKAEAAEARRQAEAEAQARAEAEAKLRKLQAKFKQLGDNE